MTSSLENLSSEPRLNDMDAKSHRKHKHSKRHAAPLKPLSVSFSVLFFSIKPKIAKLLNIDFITGRDS